MFEEPPRGDGAILDFPAISFTIRVFWPLPEKNAALIGPRCIYSSNQGVGADVRNQPNAGDALPCRGAPPESASLRRRGDERRGRGGDPVKWLLSGVPRGGEQNPRSNT